MEFKNPFRRKKETDLEQDPSLKLVPEEERKPLSLPEAVAKFDEGSPREMTFGEKLIAMGEDEERRALLSHPEIGWTPIEVIEIHGFNDNGDPNVVDHRMDDLLHSPGEDPLEKLFRES